jgi:hypothetical protein
MCDYSLAHLPNRLATQGEQLVIHRFATQALGLASVRRGWKQVLFPVTVPAVCLPPGAQLRLQDIPERIQYALDVEAVEEVTFVQLSAESFIYRDAVRFDNGREILLQSLDRGQRVDVLSLGAEDEVREVEPEAIAGNAL